MAQGRQGRRNVHYEVQGLRGASWTILDLLYEESDAMAAAEQHWSSGGHTAVRVLKERFDPDSNTFNSMEVAHKGKHAKRAGEIELGGTVGVCRRLEDFYGTESRGSIGEVLRDTLDEWQITPLELLHDIDNYYRLDGAGTLLQKAVQQAAIRVQAGDMSVQERMKLIFSLIDTSVDRLKQDAEANRIPAFKKSGFRTLVTKLDGSDDRAYLLTAAVVGFLKPVDKIADKLKALMPLFLPDLPDWAVAVLDDFVAEFLAHTPIVIALIGKRKSLGDALIAMAHLAEGHLEQAAGGKRGLTAEARAIDGLMRGHQLPRARRVLFERVRAELARNRRLTKGLLDGELKVMAQLLRAVASEEHALLTAAIEEALEERGERYLNNQMIAEYLADAADPIDSIDRLLVLEEYVIGATNKRALANYIVPIVTSPANELYFKACDGRYTDHLLALARIQKRVYDSAFQALHKQKIAGKLEEFCSAIIDGHNLFEKLGAADKTPAARGKRLLGMILDGYFTEGQPLERARAEVRRYLREPGFIEEYLAGAHEVEHPKKLADLRNRLVSAGVTDPRH